jgi:TonB-dependent starch-binding outer membrane protein SusC
LEELAARRALVRRFSFSSFKQFPSFPFHFSYARMRYLLPIPAARSARAPVLMHVLAAVVVSAAVWLPLPPGLAAQGFGSAEANNHTLLMASQRVAERSAENSTNTTNSANAAKQRMPLKSLLNDLSNRHQTLFNYNEALVRDVYVEAIASEIARDKDEIEPKLNALLSPAELRCKRLDEQTFVIQRRADSRDAKDAKDEAFAKKADGADKADNASATASASLLGKGTLLGEIFSAPASKSTVVADGTVRGTVKSALNGMKLAGATVRVKGQQRGTVADAQGNFSLILAASDTLVVSYLGFETQTVPVQGRMEIAVMLEETLVNLLDQVVVVGYGIQRKADVTGAVANVKAEELTKQPVVTAAQALQSKVAGVQVIASGAPGAAPVVRIRGTGTLLAGSEPLYVVDGMLTSDIRNINMADIASLDVLKDASATSIYGVRASNGVVLITTKRGSTPQMSVQYDGFVGFRTPTTRVPMADSRLYAEYSNEALAYDNRPPAFRADTITNNTNWFDAITRSALVHNHAVSVSGSTEKVSYFLSAGFMREEGILRNSDFERFTLRVNNEYRPTDFLRLGHNLSLASDMTNNAPSAAFTSAYRQAPIVPAQYPDGRYGSVIQNNTANPLAQINFTNDRSTGLRLQGNVFGEVTLLQGLKFRSSLALDNFNNGQRVYNPVFEVNANQRNLVSSLVNRADNGFRWIWDNTLSYDLTADAHSLRLLAGTTSEMGRSSFMVGTRQNVPAQEQYWYLNTGAASTATNEGGGAMDTRNSYIGRVNYSYADRYLLTATLRADGSSKFPVQNRWSLFPSVGAGWVLSEEEFLKGGAFSLLKLRASWGRSGNDRISSNAFIFTVASGLDYPFGAQQGLSLGNTITEVKDPNLRWEITEEINAGVEFALLENKLYGEIDYYNKLTRDALIARPIDAIFGTTSFLTNAASIRNSGVELSLNWRDQVSETVRYSVGVNFTANTNSIESVGGGLPIIAGGVGNGQVTTRTEVGQPIGSFWLYQTDGIFQNADEVRRGPALSGSRAGDFRYVDTNGDGTIDDKDRVYFGSYQPRFFAGANGSLNVGNLDFSFDLYANVGNVVYNGKKAQRFGNENIEAVRAGRWTPTNPSNTEPRASNAVPISSNYYLESGSFLRLNNVTLGYTLPAEFVQSFGAKRLRVFIAAQNPFILKAYSGFTPELPRGVLDSGLELDLYPIPSTYMFGVNIGF